MAELDIRHEDPDFCLEAMAWVVTSCAVINGEQVIARQIFANRPTVVELIVHRKWATNRLKRQAGAIANG